MSGASDIVRLSDGTCIHRAVLDQIMRTLVSLNEQDPVLVGELLYMCKVGGYLAFDHDAARILERVAMITLTKDGRVIINEDVRRVVCLAVEIDGTCLKIVRSITE